MAEKMMQVALYKKDRKRLIHGENQEGLRTGEKYSHAKFVSLLLDEYEKTRR